MEDPWIATTATVVACRYQSPGLGTVAFCFSTRRRFLITFDYYAHGRTYSDQFQSDAAVPQNEIIPLTYNPFDPQQNSRTHRPSASPADKPSLITLRVIGSVLLLVTWLSILRSCH